MMLLLGMYSMSAGTALASLFEKQINKESEILSLLV